MVNAHVGKRKQKWIILQEGDVVYIDDEGKLRVKQNSKQKDKLKNSLARIDLAIDSLRK